MRTGHTCHINIGHTQWEVVSKTKVVRDKEFDFITLVEMHTGHEVECGFTTELGKKWELWQAYRELYCNAIDEPSGIITNTLINPQTEADTTSFIVLGNEFEQVHLHRHKYILNSQPIYTDGCVEVHPANEKGIFYRGIRVYTMDKEMLFSYNFSQCISLTEDRTAGNAWQLPSYIAADFAYCTDKNLLIQALTAPENTFEHSLPYAGYGYAPSHEWIEVMTTLIRTRLTDVVPNAVKLYEEIRLKTFNFDMARLTNIQSRVLKKAIDFLEKVGYPISEYKVCVVDSLGHGTLGLAHNNTIYITIQNFDMGGTKAVASVLMEEFIHLRYGHKDCTRGMQQFLFDKYLSSLEELSGEPL